MEYEERRKWLAFGMRVFVAIGAVMLLGMIFWLAQTKELKPILPAYANFSENTPNNIQLGTVWAKINRSQYGLGNRTQEIFANLPVPPDDFYELRDALGIGIITNFCALNESYWKAPEFYVNFEKNAGVGGGFGAGVNWFLNPPAGRWGVVGYGIFPAEFGMPAENGTLCAFAHTSWGIETWQDVAFNVAYPQELKSFIEPTLHQQNNTLAQECIHVNVTPQRTLLEPSYPDFETNWTQKLTVDISFTCELPKGTYFFTVNFAQPSEKNDAWAEKYKMHYVLSGGYATSEPPLRVFIRVE